MVFWRVEFRVFWRVAFRVYSLILGLCFPSPQATLSNTTTADADANFPEIRFHSLVLVYRGVWGSFLRKNLRLESTDFRVGPF